MHSNGVEPDFDFHRKAALQAGYTLVDRIGSGASKICYSAYSADGARVALKFFNKNAQWERDARELAVMLICSHPNIARYINSGSVTVDSIELRYVVEELFQGGSLQDRIRQPLPSADVLTLGSALIDAVRYLRELKLVHRDIKPENIMFNESNRAVLTDFGIVRILGAKSLTSTSSPSGPGTPCFMPPEQYHNEKAMIDWRADQFALGVTLSLAALGMHPFGDDPQSAINGISNRESPSQAFQRDARAAGFPVLIKMVQPYPVQRYNTPEPLGLDWTKQGGVK